MVKLKLNELLDEQKITRYKLQQLTGINAPRINQLYKNEAKNISLEELDILTNVLNCSISDIIYKS